MRSIPARSWAPALALALTACSSAGTRLDTALPEANPRLADGWLLAVHSGGLDALLPDTRDAGLRRALELVDDRLVELAAEKGSTPPQPAVDLACELLGAPWTLFVGLAEDPAVTGPAFRALLVVHGEDPAAAEAWAGRLRGLLAAFGLSSREAESDPDLVAVALPPGDLVYGSHPDDSDLVLAWGPVGDLPEGFGPGLPAGVEPALVLELELGRILEQVGDHELHEFEQVFPQMKAALGELGISLSVGHSSAATQVRGRTRNWVPLIEAFGMLERGPLAGATFDVVPADATVVNLSRMNPDGFVTLVERLDAASGQAVLDEIEATLGMPLEQLVEPFEGTVGYFLSDTTGGGGPTSAVALASLADEARMNGVLERLAGHFAPILQEEAEGQVRMRPFAHGEAACWAIDFPGLPVPIEPSLAVAAGHLFVAATPHTLRAALDHAARGKGGLTEHVALRGLSRGALDGLTGLQVLDTPRLLRDGYGLFGLFTTAVENALRSPTDPAREPGPVLPTYSELLAGSRATVMLSRIDGDDLVAVGTSDGSMLAQLGATMIYVAPMLLPGMFTGFLMPVMGGLDEDEGVAPFQYNVF